jgi:hypothetical protein
MQRDVRTNNEGRVFAAIVDGRPTHRWRERDGHRVQMAARPDPEQAISLAEAR